MLAALPALLLALAPALQPASEASLPTQIAASAAAIDGILDKAKGHSTAATHGNGKATKGSGRDEESHTKVVSRSNGAFHHGSSTTPKGDSKLTVTKSGAIQLANIVVGKDGTLHASMPATALDAFLEAADATKPRPSSWPTADGCPFVYISGPGNGKDRTITLRTCLIAGASAGALQCPYDSTFTKLTAPDPACTATLMVHHNGWPAEASSGLTTTQHHHVFVASGRFPNFAESQNEVGIPSVDAWLEFRNQFKNEEQVAFLPDTVLGEDAVDHTKGTPTPTLDLLGHFATLTNWDELKSTVVPFMYTGLAGIEFYSISKHALAHDDMAVDERKRLERFQESVWGRIGLQGLNQQKAMSGKKVLWMRRTSDRVVTNEDEVVKAIYGAGATNVTVISCGEQTLKQTVLDIHSSDVVFGVHGADFANLAHIPSSSKKRVVTVQLIHCGNPGLINNAKTSAWGNWLGGYSLLLGQPYLESYMDSFMDCTDKSKDYSTDNRANFALGSLPKVTALFKQAFDILADKTEVGVTKFK